MGPLEGVTILDRPKGIEASMRLVEQAEKLETGFRAPEIDALRSGQVITNRGDGT